MMWCVRRRVSLVPYGLIQLGRLGERLHAELAIEDRDRGSVEADRARPVPAACEDRHQPPARGLVERVDLDQSRGRLRCGLGVTRRLGREREPLQHVHDAALHGDGAGRPPVVKVR